MSNTQESSWFIINAILPLDKYGLDKDGNVQQTGILKLFN